MSRVYIVRHGNTFDPGDIIRRVGGRTDLPLSSSGRDQAEALQNHFQDVRFGAAHSSDLRRTRETVETILRGVTYEISDLLKEIDYGPDEGQAETDVVARLGTKALKLWNDTAVPPCGWVVEPDSLRQGWCDFLATLSRHETTLVVTSNGVARFLLDVVQGGHQAEKKLRTGSYGIIKLESSGPVLDRWNIRP